jgi:hypothetical protein
MKLCRARCGVVLVAATLLAACGDAKFREVRRSEAPHVPGSGLHVETGNGFVRIEADTPAPGGPAAPGTVRIEAEIRARTAERLKAVTITAVRETSGILTIRPEFPGGKRESSEGCSFTIHLPDARGVEVRTSNGDVHAARLSGAASLRTSNGAVSLLGHAGPVTAKTSNAVVKADGVTEAIDVETSNGAIEVALAAGNAGPVNLRTSNGSVTLRVHPGFAGSIDAQTSNADVKVEDVAGARVERPSRGTARVAIGEGGPASRLRTSNGQIRVASTEK